MNSEARKIYNASKFIIQKLEEKYEINLDVRNVKELSRSSLEQKNNGINSSKRRVNSPGIAKSTIEGHNEKTIRENLTELFDINNPIIKLKNLAILLAKLNDFDSDYIHIYRILVWISLCILIDSKTKVLEGYNHRMYFSNDDSANKQKVIEYLQNIKPFYRIIDYNQLLFLYEEYGRILTLQNMKMRHRVKNIKDEKDYIINETVVIPTNTSMVLGLIGIKDTRKYGKIQKAINKLRTKDTTKK